jgi:hypothetical protein
VVLASVPPQGYLSLLERDQAGEFRKERPLVPDGVERHRMVLDAYEKLGRLADADRLLRDLIGTDPDEWSNYIR